jgi:hypothetical protein
MLLELFEAAYIDTKTEWLIGVRPYPEFVPMLKQTVLSELNGVFMLERDKTAEDLLRRLGVSHGSDGQSACTGRKDKFYRPRPFVQIAHSYFLSA